MHTLPLFLEGPVRHMKIVDDQARAREILRLAKVHYQLLSSVFHFFFLLLCIYELLLYLPSNFHYFQSFLLL